MSGRRTVSPIYDDGEAALYQDDCMEVLAALPDASVDAIVTDPPYELGFMGRQWDATGIAYRVDLWAEALRVIKPGGHLLAFGGTRTWHRLACAIEDAGFEVRDSIAWMYGSGFPKSLDVSKAIDKQAGAERKVVGSKRVTPKGVGGAETRTASSAGAFGGEAKDVPVTAPATSDAAAWQGWGTALKPSHEPIVVARRPLAGTVAQSVLAHGTGALNIDACRVGNEERVNQPAGSSTNDSPSIGSGWTATTGRVVSGRWPANVVLDEDMADELDRQSGIQRDGVAVKRNLMPENERLSEIGVSLSKVGQSDVTYGGAGGASRFFYVAKADTTERPRVNGVAHPTVKPLALMRWLVRLVTPPGGVVLEPFAGSGTTVEACLIEGFRCVAVEREADYIPLVLWRIKKPIERTLL